MSTVQRSVSSRGARLVLEALTATLVAGVGAAVLAVLLTVSSTSPDCSASTPGGSIALGPAGTGQPVGATEYGGSGDPSSGLVGASGANLLAHPDSYAELGGQSFQTATAMGGLPYMTPLRISWAGHSAIAYKRDFGLGGGSVAGLPRVIDLWWQLASALGIPYEHGLWSGAIRVGRPPDAGAGNLLAQSAQPVSQLSAPAPGAGDPVGCSPVDARGVALTPGSRAVLLPDGQAAAPTDAPVAVKGIIAAGNQIVGKPYLYGAAHGLALDQVAPAYDCSSSVEHLLYGGRLLAVDYGAPSGQLESFGVAGLGRWVTVYASGDHVFMYVAGLRWDTHNAAGAQDGSSGIGWHPLIRSSAGFVERHPVGL